MSLKWRNCNTFRPPFPAKVSKQNLPDQLKRLSLNLSTDQANTLMSEPKKSTHGGKRPGAGQPKKEKTDILNFRMPKSKADALRKIYGDKLTPMFREWAENLLPEELRS